MDETTVTKQALSGPLLERVFGLRAAGTDLRTEFLGGFTTFLTMVYIVFVNP
jgi:AGZA family xanthine/uracil permease-like MFS transporter